MMAVGNKDSRSMTWLLIETCKHAINDCHTATCNVTRQITGMFRQQICILDRPTGALECSGKFSRVMVVCCVLCNLIKDQTLPDYKWKANGEQEIKLEIEVGTEQTGPEPALSSIKMTVNLVFDCFPTHSL